MEPIDDRDEIDHVTKHRNALLLAVVDEVSELTSELWESLAMLEPNNIAMLHTPMRLDARFVATCEEHHRATH